MLKEIYWFALGREWKAEQNFVDIGTELENNQKPNFPRVKVDRGQSSCLYFAYLKIFIMGMKFVKLLFFVRCFPDTATKK